MTGLAVKDFLQSVREGWEELKHLEEEMEVLRASLLPSGIHYEGIRPRTDGAADRMADIMAKIEDCERRTLEAKTRQFDRHMKAFDLIRTLEKSEYRMVLFLYYLHPKRLKWVDVAKKMEYYSENRIFQFHREALKALQVYLRTCKYGGEQCSA